MNTSCMLLCVVLLGPGLPDDDPIRDRDEPNGSLADQFSEIEDRFEARRRAYVREFRMAKVLDSEARSKKVAEENQAFNTDWFAMVDEVRALIRAHPNDPDAFQGLLLLSGTMRSNLDLDLLRDHFMDDPRMGRLASSLSFRSEDWSKEILETVAAKHSDARVRGQATYSLGINWRFSAETMTMDRAPTESEKAECLDEAKRYFTLVTTDFPDTISADDSFRLAEKAEAELARIARRPFLEIGQVAPEIVGKDRHGNPLTLSDHRGKVVVLCFWSHRWSRSVAMIPLDRELVGRLQDRPLTLLGVNSDEPDAPQKALDSTQDYEMTSLSWADGDFQGLIRAFDITPWPTVYVLDPDGVIRHITIIGEPLNEAVDSLLTEMATDSATISRE